MNIKKLFVVILCLLPLSVLAQKAFENVVFKGKVQNIGIRLNYADGYLGACDIKTTDLHTRKTSHFTPEQGTPDEAKHFKFEHYSKADPTKKLNDYFVLDNIDEAEQAPKRIHGRYYLAGKAYAFVLVKFK